MHDSTSRMRAMCAGRSEVSAAGLSRMHEDPVSARLPVRVTAEQYLLAAVPEILSRHELCAVLVAAVGLCRVVPTGCYCGCQGL